MLRLVDYQILKTIVILITGYFLVAHLGAQPATTLRAAAEKANLNFGFAIGNQINDGDQAAMNLVNSQANILVNENSMKFGSVESSRGVFDFSRPEVVVKFAEANGMRMRGHTIAWAGQSGFAENLNSGRADMLKLLKTHIDSTIGHFKGRIREWDVVNEAGNIEGAGLRNNFWKANIGDDYIDSAFVWAHKADPDAKLFYNEFWAEWINEKSDFLYNLVKTMKQKGIPIDGVGFQSHSGNSIDKASYSANIKRLGDLGLMVSLTEVDVDKAGTTTSGWKNLMEACLENANCVSFLTWGIDDAHSWLSKGRDCDCLLYNSSLQPKLNVATLIAAMNTADSRIAAARKVFGGGGGVHVSQFSNLKKPNLIRTQNEIKYNLIGSASVRLDIFNMNGSSIRTLVKARQSMGEQTILWDEQTLLPGLYFIQLQIDGKKEMTKMVLSR
jgi:endo-1,4-beta-xylanase